jgi:hypothetical protein
MKSTAFLCSGKSLSYQFNRLLWRGNDGCTSASSLDETNLNFLEFCGLIARYLYLEAEEQSFHTSENVRKARLLEWASPDLAPISADLFL